MAKFETLTKIRTPDGVEHDSREEAEAHVFALALVTLGESDEDDLKLMIDRPQDTSKEVTALRDALRAVYLAAFPRANKGVKRGAKE